MAASVLRCSPLNRALNYGGMNEESNCYFLGEFFATWNV